MSSLNPALYTFFTTVIWKTLDSPPEDYHSPDVCSTQDLVTGLRFAGKGKFS